jgi:hypothetical protein
MLKRLVLVVPIFIVIIVIGCARNVVSPPPGNVATADEGKQLAADASAAKSTAPPGAASLVAGAKTATTGLLSVTHANGNCTSNTCWNPGSPNPGGCAGCVTLNIFLPLGSQVTAIRCYTNAGGPNGDIPAPYQSKCGDLDVWATFDRPVLYSTPSNVVVTTIFHNRAKDRDRKAELQADWQ